MTRGVQVSLHDSDVTKHVYAPGRQIGAWGCFRAVCKLARGLRFVTCPGQVPVFKEERVNTEGSRSISNIKAAPLNQQRMATPIPASRHWTRSSLELGANGSMCMTVHNTIEHLVVCQRLSNVVQDNSIHVRAEFWDKFGTTTGQIYS